MESSITLNELLTATPITHKEDEGEFSYLYGRRAYCKDLGLSGKEFRECKKNLRKQDKGLSHKEKKALAIQRKSGSGLTANSPTPKVPPLGDTSVLPEGQYTPSQDPFKAQEDAGSGNKTAIIIGVSVGVIGLTILTIYLIRKYRK